MMSFLCLCAENLEEALLSYEFQLAGVGRSYML